MLKKIKGWFKNKQQEKINKIVDEEIKMMKARIEKLEEFMKYAKDFQTKKNLGVDKTRKWLNGYPDETEAKKEA